MAVSFRILTERGLVYVLYEGFARLEDSFHAFSAYAQHPDCRPGQRQFVDLSGVTAVERDFVGVIALQAMKAEVFVAQGVQTLVAYYAPSEPARTLAALAIRSWDGTSGVVPRIFETEEAALAFLGQTETRVVDLLAAAG
ncbi:MAG: hypothetical protein GC186_03275 [Rhodobacteraceae bacterium]|nr:hypothetical protein [Paracoccaceae bacterium]